LHARSSEPPASAFSSSGDAVAKAYPRRHTGGREGRWSRHVRTAVSHPRPREGFSRVAVKEK
jgi:hypothetical protein